MSSGRWMITAVALAAALAGCAEPVRQRPPETVGAIGAAASAEDAFPTYTVILHNVQRVLDRDLADSERLASLELVDRVDGAGSAQLARLATVLSRPDDSSAVRLAVLDLLVRRSHPGLAPHVVRGLQSEPDAAMRDRMLAWLRQHPAPEVLAEVVEAWAQVPTGNDAGFAPVVETLSGQPWDQALVAAVNTPGFLAAGAAVEILASRLGASVAQRRLLELTPQSPAAEAMTLLARATGFFPLTRAEVAAAEVLVAERRAELDRALRQADHWQREYGYRFDIRDVHLLSRCWQDPYRMLPPRASMVQMLAAAIDARPHATRFLAAADVDPSRSRAALVDRLNRLTVAELAGVYLIHEMLNRPAVQEAILQAGGTGGGVAGDSWVGLVFYENGSAETRTYPPARAGAEIHGMDRRMLHDAAFCLAVASGRSGGPSTGVGPTEAHLRQARDLHLRGLVLTRLGARSFHAAWYNGEGIRISLGNFAASPASAAP